MEIHGRCIATAPFKRGKRLALISTFLLFRKAIIAGKLPKSGHYKTVKKWALQLQLKRSHPNLYDFILPLSSCNTSHFPKKLPNQDLAQTPLQTPCVPK
jgi:hypothetical protein